MRRAFTFRNNITRFRKSFQEHAHDVSTALREDVLQVAKKARTVPRWLRILRTIYHDYGLKHVCLMSLLVVYQFLGAGIFYLCEAGHDEELEQTWIANITTNRTEFVNKIIPTLFNNTEFLFFLTSEQSELVRSRLNADVAAYEKQLGIRYTDQKIKWDFWNAMLYAQTICTTIGYGHLYPQTTAGRTFTMLYAIIGIPLVLSILDDLGKLLTKCLKSPWWLLKCGCRRAFRYCTKQTLEEIRRLDEEDKRDLEIFDLPIPVAILVVIIWIFFCSATFIFFETDWDYFVAFYFFFISLSTIGLGDITPTEPKYLLMLFIYIIIGLSLVSMCINLIQAKLERTYEGGRSHLHEISSLDDRAGGIYLEVGKSGGQRIVTRRGSSLGVFRTSSSSHSLTREAVQAAMAARKHANKACQTVLSFPSPQNGASIGRSISNSRMKFLPRTLSIDDVMKLVDTEEGDILVLTQLVRDESVLSGSSSNTNSDMSHIVVSKSFDAFSPGSSMTAPTSSMIPRDPSINELEAIEEMEDQIALGQLDMANSVHFRSRLSLIPEQHSVIEEVDGEEDSEDEETTIEVEPPKPQPSPGPSRFETYNHQVFRKTRSPTPRGSISGFFSGVFKRKRKPPKDEEEGGAGGS